MPGSLIRKALLAAVIVAAPAAAQDLSVLSQTARDEQASAIAVPDLVAGVRDYPARVLRSLLQLAEEPLVLRQLADEPELLERPENIRPPVAAELHAAIRELSVMPAIVAVAAEHPAELAALRELYDGDPQEIERYTLQLRAAYDQANLGATVGWQAALERDSAALEAYRELVTRFCEAQRSVHAGYPCVEVLDRDYYYACPPNGAIIFYALEHAESSAATQVIEQWWNSYAPYELDARILGDNREAIEFAIGPATVAAMPPQRRAAMWTAAGGSSAGSIGLVPVIMQPPADQPSEARYARAVAEHARLWTPELSSELAEDGAVVERSWYDEQPVEEVVYVDDAWDYSSDWTYYPVAYSPLSTVSRHVYYTPIVVYYRGYPIDWPLFYGCDPHWLVRFRICSGHARCGYGRDYGVHCYHRTGSRMTVCHDRDGRRGDHCDWWQRHGHHGAVRVGSRTHHRCASDQVARTSHDRRSSHGPARSGQRLGSDHARRRPTSGIRSGVSRLPTRTGAHPRSSLGRPPNTNTRSGQSLSPSIGRRGSSSGSGRSPSASPSTRVSSRLRSIISSRRSNSSSRNPSASSRTRASSRLRSIISSRRSSSSGRSPSASRTRSSSRPRSIISSRRSSSSSRSPSASARTKITTRPRNTISSRRGGSSGRSAGASSRRSASPKSSRSRGRPRAK